MLGWWRKRISIHQHSSVVFNFSRRCLRLKPLQLQLSGWMRTYIDKFMDICVVVYALVSVKSCLIKLEDNTTSSSLRQFGERSVWENCHNCHCSSCKGYNSILFIHQLNSRRTYSSSHGWPFCVSNPKLTIGIPGLLSLSLYLYLKVIVLRCSLFLFEFLHQYTPSVVLNTPEAWHVFIFVIWWAYPQTQRTPTCLVLANGMNITAMWGTNLILKC